REARRPARAPGASKRGPKLLAPRGRALVECALVGEPVLERSRKRRAPAPRARVAVLAADPPQELPDAKQVRTVGRRVDPARHLAAAVNRDALIVRPLAATVACATDDERGDARVRVGLVPHLAREERRKVLMTRRAHRAARVDDLPLAALAIVPHHLKLEP